MEQNAELAIICTRNIKLKSFHVIILGEGIFDHINRLITINDVNSVILINWTLR